MNLTERQYRGRDPDWVASDGPCHTEPVTLSVSPSNPGLLRMLDTDDNKPPRPPLTDTAVGAVAAFLRVCELYDPAVAHRAALRAIVASLVADLLDLDVDHSVVVASAALVDIDLVVTRPADPEAAHEPSRSLLGETIVARVPGLQAVGLAVGSVREHWDGSGSPAGRSGTDIPFVSRLVAVVDALVGNPAAGFVPTWDHARGRVSRLSGSHLDPTMCALIDSIDLEGIDAPPIPSATLLTLLDTSRNDESATVGTATATTIKSAVAAAGHTDDLLALFAQTARKTISASEVVVLRLTPTQLESDAIARAVDGQRPTLSLERLDDLREFSTQAELRAGVTLERSLNGLHTDELIAPIMVADEAWGVIAATRRSDDPAFDAHDLSVLRHIASEAAAAISSTTHWARMERMALRDQLTGLANRHELYRVLDTIFERPPLERVDSALIMCDVDGLKVINDTLGHQAGDRLLIDAAAALRGAVRDAERTTVCRIGGDEFCMVIDGGALLTAHDISDMIERLFARSAGSGTPRSISCGIAFASEDITSRSALLRAADENQYQTKRARKAERAELLATITEEAGPVVDRRAIRD